jgi:hypothetical protein
MFFGFIVLVALLVFGGIKISTQREAAAYEPTAVPYLKMVIPELSTWDPQTIKSYMAPESLRNTPEENIIKIVEHLSKLGALKELAEPDFSKLFTSAAVDGGREKIVTYSIDAVYENGNAVLTVSLLDLGDSFQIYKFNFNSSALQ